MNTDVLKAIDSDGDGFLFNIFPILLNFQFVRPNYQKFLRDTIATCSEFAQTKIDEAKVCKVVIGWYGFGTYSADTRNWCALRF